MPLAAIRVTSTLKSIQGSNHIYPPTFADMGHNLVGFDKNTETFKAVQVDSVGSFANRIEQALADANILPNITTRINNDTLSIHELPHRAYDAILRDSTLDGKPWPNSDIGRAVLNSDANNATALFTYAPLTLLLGGWNSFGGDAVRGAKISRALSGEIWGYDGYIARHCTQRSDPLKIPSSISPHKMVDGILTETADKDKKSKKPSELGHGDIPSCVEKGVFIDGRIELNGAISVTRLKRYAFPDHNGGISAARDAAGHHVLIELAKLGMALALERLDLRSGCELYTESRTVEAIDSSGTIEPITLPDNDRACRDALKQAAELGLTFNDAPVELEAGHALAKLASEAAAKQGA